MTAIRVLHPGLLTTVQDLGRRGHQHEGVPEGGAMDAYAARLANLLAGNADSAATLEMTLTGPSLVFDQDAVIALTGGEFDARLDGAPLVAWRATAVRAGSRLDVGHATRGCRGYLAVAGGIDVPVVLGSRSTCLVASFGGFRGRALRAGDVLSTGTEPERAGGVESSGAGSARGLSPSLRPPGAATIRVIASDPGATGEESIAALTGAAWQVSARSDRMGYRLDGPALATPAAADVLSAAVTMGTVQLPPGGSPILLMADRQTTGGYPVAGQVATVDLGAVAQLRPGDTIRFSGISLDAAQRLYLERERSIEALRRALLLSP